MCMLVRVYGYVCMLVGVCVLGYACVYTRVCLCIGFPMSSRSKKRKSKDTCGVRVPKKMRHQWYHDHLSDFQARGFDYESKRTYVYSVAGACHELKIETEKFKGALEEARETQGIDWLYKQAGYPVVSVFFPALC